MKAAASRHHPQRQQKKKKAFDTSDENLTSQYSQEKMASPRELAIDVEKPARRSSRDRGRPISRSKSPSDAQQQSPASWYTNGGSPGGTSLPSPPVSPMSLTPGGGNAQQLVCNPYYIQYQQQLLGWLQHQQQLQQKQQLQQIKKAQKQQEKEEQQKLQQQKKQQEYRQQQLLQLQRQQDDLAKLVSQDSKIIQQDFKPSSPNAKLEL